MFFKRIGPKISWSSGVGTSTDCHSFISEYFIQYFAVKWKAPCWTKQHRKFFTGNLWTLVNRWNKATCLSCAFKDDDILNACNSNLVQLQVTSFFLYKGWCYGDTIVSCSHMLISELQTKKLCIYSSTYPLKNFF